MTSYQIMYWYDIPVQVRAGGRRDRVSIELPERFQVAVDAAAMAAAMTGTDAYLEGFRWSDPLERDGTPQEVAEAVAAVIEEEHPQVDWRKTVDAIKAAR